MLPLGVYGGTEPLFELGAIDETGLRPSDEPLLGGVSRFPTLVKEVGTEAGCAYECAGYFCCRLASGGGGSSNVPRCEALGRRAVKLFEAPKWSGPGTIEGG
jgi:hypothetical protein